MIVSDTGPIIAFARLGRLSLLRQVFHILIIPDAVFDELVRSGPHQPGAPEALQGEWIQTRAVIDQNAVAQLPPRLHAGEREAIVLAHEYGTQILIDEQRGRAVARAMGVKTIGSLRVLAEAKAMGIITAVHPLIEALQTIRYWIDQSIIHDFLEEMDEIDH
jgi:predicted nucleic acid-binding protein